MDAAIPADAQNAPTGIWKSRTEREIPTAPTPIIVVVNERKNNGDSNSVAKPSTESDQVQWAVTGGQRAARRSSMGYLGAAARGRWRLSIAPFRCPRNVGRVFGHYARGRGHGNR